MHVSVYVCVVSAPGDIESGGLSNSCMCVCVRTVFLYTSAYIDMVYIAATAATGTVCVCYFLSKQTMKIHAICHRLVDVVWFLFIVYVRLARYVYECFCDWMEFSLCFFASSAIVLCGFKLFVDIYTYVSSHRTINANKCNNAHIIYLSIILFIFHSIPWIINPFEVLNVSIWFYCDPFLLGMHAIWTNNKHFKQHPFTYNSCSIFDLSKNLWILATWIS